MFKSKLVKKSDEQFVETLPLIKEFRLQYQYFYIFVDIQCRKQTKKKNNNNKSFQNDACRNYSRSTMEHFNLKKGDIGKYFVDLYCNNP